MDTARILSSTRLAAGEGPVWAGLAVGLGGAVEGLDGATVAVAHQNQLGRAGLARAGVALFEAVVFATVQGCKRCKSKLSKKKKSHFISAVANLLGSRIVHTNSRTVLC